MSEPTDIVSGMDQRISLITLGVADLARAREFYETGLGWSKGNAEDSVAFYQLSNGMILGLWSREDLAADTKVVDTGATFSGITIAFNARSRAEVDDILAQAEAAGGRSPRPPKPSSGAATRAISPILTDIPGKSHSIPTGRSTSPDG